MGFVGRAMTRTRALPKDLTAMQTIRELGANIWSRPWLAGVLHALNRLQLGLTYAAISAALVALHRVFVCKQPIADGD